MSNSINGRYHQQNIDRNLLRKPDSFVYIFSVSKRAFPSGNPLVRTPVKACGPTQRYTVVAALPEPYQQPDIEQINGAVVARSFDARRVAMDFCNPSNTTVDQDFVMPPQNIFGFGNNLTQQGVFWVVKEECTFEIDGKRVAFGTKGALPVPPEEELAKAEHRREVYYAGLIEQARVLELSDPKGLNDALNQDYHLAAEYFDIETSWHKTQVRAVQCPQCGERKKEGIKFHPLSNGVFCIEASKAGWEAAVDAGIKSKTDVPAKFA
jgi:hypothetical protein